MLIITLLCLFAFFAGMTDAVVGGGGLIQAPALFNILPSTSLMTLLGTNKIASTFGTAFAARSYIGKVKINWKLVLPAALGAFVMSILGATAVSFVPQKELRILVLVLMILMAIYTFFKKDFGAAVVPREISFREQWLATITGGIIGFYDGLFGPGTGSFLIFMFVKLFSLDFIQASASSKVVNLTTNIAALMFFIPNGKVLFHIACFMAVSNVAGAFAGTWFAVRLGAPFIRKIFLILLLSLICKQACHVIAYA